jgi:hypothetical protein
MTSVDGKHAEKLTGGAGIATIDARPGLLHHLLDQPQHLLELLAQAIQLHLRQDISATLHASGDFRGELLRLSNHPDGRIEQLAVRALELLRTLLGSGAGRPRNIEHPQLHTPAAVTQFAGLAGNLGDLLHGANEHTYPSPSRLETVG